MSSWIASQMDSSSRDQLGSSGSQGISSSSMTSLHSHHHHALAPSNSSQVRMAYFLFIRYLPYTSDNLLLIVFLYNRLLIK